jgi:uncharacterized membrane protein
MEENHGQISELLTKINLLSNRQDLIKEEIESLKRAVHQLSQVKHSSEKIERASQEVLKPEQVVIGKIKPTHPTPPKENLPPFSHRAEEKGKLEDFIGANLLNKFGIAILVLGIGFGVKYAIDHQMLDPLTRVILGYLAGMSIIGFAMKLKKNYEAFSAVLLSGGIASLYFITFAAYDFYGFIPQVFAFILMVAFTGFTVFAATTYNLQVIAIIGLVGAYAVPFLLSDGSGRVLVLFSYMTIINGGILVLSFVRKWHLLFTVAFVLSWLIFVAWVFDGYKRDEHIWLALIFATLFFVIFYLSFLMGKFVNRLKLAVSDIAVVLLNCFIYYGLGYSLINDYPEGELYLGMFTLANAIVHFAVCVIIYKKIRESKDTFYFVAGLVLVFITIAVPVQLESNWVTLVWSLQACLLFWIGRSKQYPVYELLSYPLVGLAVISLLHDWSAIWNLYSNYDAYEPTRKLSPIFNINFFTSLVVATAFGFIVWLSQKVKSVTTSRWLNNLLPALYYVLPVFGLGILFLAIYQEIGIFFTNKFVESRVFIRSQGVSEYNYDWRYFHSIWKIIYSFAFFSGLWLVNNRFFKNQLVHKVILGTNGCIILFFLTEGLTSFEDLRYSFLSPGKFYMVSAMNIVIRYVGYLFVTIALFVNFTIAKDIHPTIRKMERLFCHFTILTLLSSELLSLLALSNVSNGFKLSLTILWGCYALYLIVWGFTKDQAYLRISGIVLFAITILKLFFYDMAGMEAIAKTIVLIILGVLLLVASFLYNKRKKKESN